MFNHHRVIGKGMAVSLFAIAVLCLSGCEKYLMNGSVVDNNSHGVADVPIKVDGTAENGKVIKTTLTTDENGDFDSKLLPHGFTGTITPILSAAFAQVVPGSRSYTNVQSDQTNQDFVATRVMVSLSGQVCDGGGGIAGADVAAVGNDGDGNSFDTNAVTDATGNYSVMVPWGWVGTTTPSKAGYTFDAQACSVP